MQNYVYVSTRKHHPEILKFESIEGHEVEITWRRVFFQGLTQLTREIVLQYSGAGLSSKSAIYLALRNQLSVIFRDPIMGIRDLIVGYEGRFSSLEKRSLPISVVSSETEIQVWLGRNAVTTGFRSKHFDAEIEWERLRFSKRFDFFVWGLKPNYLNPAKPVPFDEHLFIATVNVESNLANQNGHYSRELKFKSLVNGVVQNGVFIRVGSDVHFIDPSNAIEEVSWPTSKVRRHDGSFKIVESFGDQDAKLDEAFFFGSSTSWYHFLVEVLPRFLLSPNKDFEGSNVVVRSEIPQSINEVLRYLGFRNIISLEDGQALQVEFLNTLSDFRFDKPLDIESRASDLELVRSFFKSDILVRDPQRRIYLKRHRNLFRPLYGQRRIERYLLNSGFEVISPEKLTFFEQMKLFNDARIVVSESGAALTNMLFMKSQALVIEINPGKDPIKLWSRFASTIGLRCEVVEGKPIRIVNFLTGVGMYRVNFKKFRFVIEANK
jgi:hypothetical protein